MSRTNKPRRRYSHHYSAWKSKHWVKESRHRKLRHSVKQQINTNRIDDDYEDEIPGRRKEHFYDRWWYD